MSLDPKMIDQKMKSVMAACDLAPSGPERDACLGHYRAAELAFAAHRDAEAVRELDAASHALG